MSSDSDTVFVGMPFGDDSDLVFKSRCDSVFDAIEDVCDSLGLDAERVDQYAGSRSIPSQIKRMIQRADILIFDLTREKPNVYYEVGYAHGIDHDGDNMIFIAEKGTKVHFDLAHRAVKYFTDIEELRKILKAELEAMTESEDDE